jgi:hypothetical protein|uniref:Uncharacterized protein n=1 Tax=viral metagenome TaxID=1070528 RepID=A0A6C0H0C7_9ZZZZ
MLSNKIINILFYLFLAIIISTIIFAIYVEISPHMKNIWYRTNSSGEKSFQLENLFILMSGPLNYDFYWHPRYYDINYFIYLFITFIIIEIIK